MELLERITDVLKTNMNNDNKIEVEKALLLLDDQQECNYREVYLIIAKLSKSSIIELQNYLEEFWWSYAN